MNRVVVVTGMGVVSSIAKDKERHCRHLWSGETGMRRTDPATAYQRVCGLEAPVADFDRKALIKNRMLRKLLTTSAAYAVVAAGEALRDAGLAENPELLSRCGLFAGSVCIDFKPEMFIPALRESLDEKGGIDIARFALRGLQLIDPLFIVKTLPNGGIGGIAIEYQVTGPSLNITNGTVSGLQAIDAGARAVRSGVADVALAGSHDSMLSMDSIAEHLVAGRLADGVDDPQRACRPFANDRCGYVLGEASAFVVLESEEHARRRGALPYGTILGAGQSTEVAVGSGGDREGLVNAARGALEASGVSAEKVDVAFGDGLAVETDDLYEVDAMRRVFEHERVPFTSSVASVGFTGACTGALSLVHALQSMRTGVVPPTINCEWPDTACTLDLVREPREMAVHRALVWNSDGGVKNAAVMLGGWEG